MEPASDPALQRALESSLRRLFESAPDAMVVVTGEGAIVLVNTQAEQLFGYGRDELLGQDVEILVPDGLRDRHPGHRSEYFADPHTRPMGMGLGLYGRRKDGTEVPVEISLSPLVTEYGTLVSSAIRDVTEHRRAEEVFRGLLESAPDAMVIVNGSGEIVLVNAQAEKLFDYQRDDLLGQPVEMLVPDRFRVRHEAHRADYFVSPQPRPMGVDLELYGRRRDGSEFLMELSLGPLEAADGTLVSSAIRDVTDRRRSDDEASHFRSVVVSSQDAIIGKTLDGIITSWNAGAERLYGYTAAEAVGKSISMLVPSGHDDDLPDILRQVRKGVQVDNFETVRQRKDGTEVDVSLTVSPIRERGGKVIGASSIKRDITARRRVQDQLRQRTERDPLTGLRNRSRFEQDVREQVDRSKRFGELATLIMIDLNNFTEVNTAFGLRTGDQVLKAIARALQARFREKDVVARIGDDEFALLIPYVVAEDANAIVEDLRQVIGECRIEVDDHSEVHLSTSIGLAQIDQDTPNADAALSRAHRLMRREKHPGRWEVPGH